MGLISGLPLVLLWLHLWACFHVLVNMGLLLWCDGCSLTTVSLLFSEILDMICLCKTGDLWYFFNVPYQYILITVFERLF